MAQRAPVLTAAPSTASPAAPCPAFVDRTARVSPSAELGEGVEIGPGAVVEDEAVVGAGTRVLAHAFIGARAVIGERCEVHMGAVVGHAPQIRGFVGPGGHVVVGADTIVREHATIHRASRVGDATRLGRECYVMAHAHVAHDCVVEDGVTLANGALLAGHVHVGAHAFVSGNAVVHQFVRLGERAMVGGQAAVGRDVLPFVIVVGRSHVRGLNVVGLRRAGYDAAQRARIRRAYTILFSEGRPLADAIQAIRELGDHPESRALADFVSASRRGSAARLVAGWVAVPEVAGRPSPFDESLAAYPVVVVSTASVLDLLEVTHASARIEEYHAAMRAGARFPPVSVVSVCGRLVIADGHKRLAAARACGLDAIPVEVWTWRQWAGDQLRQARGNLRKNARILVLLPTRPGEALALAGTTAAHWRRVVVSLATRARHARGPGPSGH